MELRPGYKQTEVGVIPEDWYPSKLGEEVDLLTGFPFASSGYSKSGVRLVRGSNVKRGEIDWDASITEFWPEISGNIYRYQLRENDVVIAMDGALVGRSYAVIGKWDLPSLLLQRVARLRAPKVEQGLIAAWVGSVAFERHVDSVKTQTAIPHISPDDIRSLSIAVPKDRKEQSAIAGALGDVDALLSGLDALIAKKRDLKQATMQQLLTGKTRLPGFCGEWELRRLGNHVSFIKNGVNSRAELGVGDRAKYLHYGDIHTTSDVFLLPESASMPTLAAEKAARLGRLADGDVVFVDATEDLAGVGKSVEIRGIGGAEVVAGLHTIAARFDKAILADGFKAYLQFIPAFGRHLRTLAAGTKVFATNRAHIASAEIALPSTEEQVAIAEALHDMDAELSALEARRDKTRLLKQGMMQELLTGRTRLA